MTILRTLGVAVLLACAGCASPTTTSTAVAPEAVAAATPSPRAECAPAHVTLYFGQQVASDEPVVTPLLNDFMARIQACEAAGGALRSISIVTSADPGQNARDSHAQVERRQDRVRAALINVGAPADKIVAGVERQESVMGRRAEISADLY